MTLGELIGPEAKLPAPWSAKFAIAGLTADSRAVKPGYLFAALPGAKTDGARFIDDALARGAAAILMPRRRAAARPATLVCPVVEDADPRRRLALIAARFFGAQPEIASPSPAPTARPRSPLPAPDLGGAGLRAASLGTVGVVGPHGTHDARAHHARSDRAAPRSSPSLPRTASLISRSKPPATASTSTALDGVALAAGAFTNISRDHLDYHATFEAYFAAKLRLFRELLPPGAAAVVNVDSEGGEHSSPAAQERAGSRSSRSGATAASLRLAAAAATARPGPRHRA